MAAERMKAVETARYALCRPMPGSPDQMLCAVIANRFVACRFMEVLLSGLRLAMAHGFGRPDDPARLLGR
jgi:hypothetical protein